MSDTTEQRERPGAPDGGVRGALDRYFSVTQRRSTFGRELRGGLVTFFTMAYIVVLNPIIIGGTVGDPRNRFLSNS